MTKLKLGAIEDDKPVRLTIELPAALHRDLVAYAQALSIETTQSAVDRDCLEIGGAGAEAVVSRLISDRTWEDLLGFRAFSLKSQLQGSLFIACSQ